MYVNSCKTNSFTIQFSLCIGSTEARCKVCMNRDPIVLYLNYTSHPLHIVYTYPFQLQIICSHNEFILFIMISNILKLCIRNTHEYIIFHRIPITICITYPLHGYWIKLLGNSSLKSPYNTSKSKTQTYSYSTNPLRSIIYEIYTIPYYQFPVSIVHHYVISNFL